MPLLRGNWPEKADAVKVKITGIPFVSNPYNLNFCIWQIRRGLQSVNLVHSYIYMYVAIVIKNSSNTIIKLIVFLCVWQWRFTFRMEGGLTLPPFDVVRLLYWLSRATQGALTSIAYPRFGIRLHTVCW